MRFYLLIVAACCLSTESSWAQEQPVGDRLYQAVRSNNLATLKTLVASTDVNARDARGASPLMHAAAFGNAGQMELLLKAGADVNAHNVFNATALIWAGGDPVKSRLLLEHGADVNVLTQQGRTPLMMAAKRHGNAELVRILLAKGAKASAAGDSTMVIAAQSGDVEIMRLLIKAGVGVNAAAGRLGETALHYAATSGSVEAVRLLLANGAEANVGLQNVTAERGGATLAIGFGKQTPLMWAAPSASPELIRALVEGGANVNAQDVRGMSPLMLAVASETQDVEVVKVLLASGADVKARDGHGETALDWASKYGSRPVLSALRAAGAKEGTPYTPPAPPPQDDSIPDAARAVGRSVALLERSNAEFFKQSGCIGCHHQDVTAFAIQAARGAGIPLNEVAARERREAVRTGLRTLQESYLQGIVPDTNVQANHLEGLGAGGYLPDIGTDSAVVSIVPGQYPDGHWQRYNGGVRSPTADGSIVWTAQSVMVLKHFSIPARQAEFEERIARACEWLLKARPRTTYEHALQLLALSEAGLEKAKLKPIADPLLARQRGDGGWGGNPNLGSEAHSTGVALRALRESNFLSPASAPYRRAVQYLLTTQYPDGSWYVRSRAVGFQPYFQSGFPFEHDQWISAAGTGWAAEAIARSMESPAAISAGR